MKQLDLFDLDQFNRRSPPSTPPPYPKKKEEKPQNSKPPPQTETNPKEKLFCNKPDNPCGVLREYFPRGKAGGNHQYYRFSYREGSKVKHKHIPGGNIESPLAQKRAYEIEAMIKLGYSLKHILETIENYKNSP